MNTYHIHIKGIVQGVGFRPFVYRLARESNVPGWVNNTVDGVHIEFNADEIEADVFYQTVIQNIPRLARVEAHVMTRVDHKSYAEFNIVSSRGGGDMDLPVTPDFALCDDCRHELHDRKNDRYRYPFITCTNCGPRYSILTELPYDRVGTTMQSFTMCERCCEEYENPADRRYYSQTNSCPQCGITLNLLDVEANASVTGHKALSAVVSRLDHGQILAIKGIGGYLLVCDATNQETIERLRERKHRPTKPFAIMYPDISSMEADVIIDEQAATWLHSEVAPIVLLPKRRDGGLQIAEKAVAPGLNRLGCMLPYAPLLELILHDLGRPVVATSGNIHGSPIIYEDQQALENLTGIADAVLLNDREIVLPQDDSVLSFTATNGRKVVLRRSRGLAPNYFNPELPMPKQAILAMGADMKSAFCMVADQRLYISQYLGDMENYLTQESYEKTLEKLMDLFRFSPELILVDQHPNYFTRQLGEKRARKDSCEIRSVQHHKAHFAAVLGENDLLETGTPVLGVIWDGTGYGDDGQIWGGEFFRYQAYQFERVAHLEYFPMILGDKMAREPRISAMSVCRQDEQLMAKLRDKFSAAEWQTYRHMLSGGDETLLTSSMGRLFDAVACVILGVDRVSYEGEAAMLLESAASGHRLEQDISLSMSYFAGLEELPMDVPLYLLQKLVDDLSEGREPGECSLRFHITLVDLVRHMALKLNLHHLAFSGGVLQNVLLNDLLLQLLSKEFKLYFHRELSPNDENIAFGQVVYNVMSDNLNKVEK